MESIGERIFKILLISLFLIGLLLWCLVIFGCEKGAITETPTEVIEASRGAGGIKMPIRKPIMGPMRPRR